MDVGTSKGLESFLAFLREPLGLLLHRLYRTRGKHPRDQNVAEVVPVETPRGHQEPRQGPLGGLRGKLCQRRINASRGARRPRERR